MARLRRTRRGTADVVLYASKSIHVYITSIRFDTGYQRYHTLIGIPAPYSSGIYNKVGPISCGRELKVRKASHLAKDRQQGHPGEASQNPRISRSLHIHSFHIHSHIRHRILGRTRRGFQLAARSVVDRTFPHTRVDQKRLAVVHIGLVAHLASRRTGAVSLFRSKENDL